MKSDDLQQLKIDLAGADPTHDGMFHDLLKRSVSLMGLSISEISKVISLPNSIIEDWIDGNTTPTVALRPWIFKYLIKQIETYGELVSYHALDEYGYKYNFNNATIDHFNSLTYQLSKCGPILQKLQLSYTPPTIRLSFFSDSTSRQDVSCIEELHYLIAGLGGYPVVYIGGSDNAMVIPLSKYEKEGAKHNFSMSIRHCYELKDGCHLAIGGRCVCACCLLEKKELLPKVAI
jgi:hypothetical protein